MSASNVFRAYDIRGVVDKDFNEAWVERLGKACGTYMQAGGIQDVIVGRDCRHSSPAYHKALVTGLTSTGTNVVSVGMVPTPGFYFAVKHLQRKGGVMITASHNPSEYNGFKVWAGESTIHGDEILRIRDIMDAGKFAEGKGVYSEHDILPSYKEAIISRVKLGRPLKVVVDGGNGTGGDICCEVLKAIGVDVIAMYCTPDGDFPNHHPDPVVEENMRDLIARVQTEKADFGVGLDGDSDRLGVVDANGKLLAGDELLSIYASELLARRPGSIIMGDVKCSQRLFDAIRAMNGEPLMWTTGHSLIKAHMREVGSPLAGEMSGHMFFADGWYGFDDGIYGAARIAGILSNMDTPLTELPGWPPAFSTREITVPCPDAIKFAVVKKAQDYFSAKYPVNKQDGARVSFADGWGLVRASNTQPALVMRFEAATQESLAAIQKGMQDIIQEWIDKA